MSAAAAVTAAPPASSSAAPVVSVRRLSHAYRRGSVVEPVLHDIDLAIRPGEFVLLMGPSGCGKSTLLHIVGLMLAPTAADSVRIADVETRGASESARTRLRRDAIGFIFQRFNLLPTISARRNVALPLGIRGERDGGRVDALLARVGIRDMAHKRPGQMSVGQQQRVAIARALVTRPRLLLADEPTGNLDSENTAAVLALLADVHRELGQTILMITHNESLAVAADRVLRMRDGRISGP